MIKLKKINKIYQLGEQRLHALQDIDLNIQAGELVALVGTSGSGKSTLMNIIGLLDHPTSGHYHLNDTDVAQYPPQKLARLRNQTLGFIFQQFYLLPRFNALYNVSLPLIYRGLTKPEIKRRALLQLEQVGLSEYINHKPNELSGGQQQRVAIARALVGNPSLILADEPTGSLDSQTGQEIMDLLINQQQKHNTTVIIVTHDDMIAKQCQRLIAISDGKLL